MSDNVLPVTRVLEDSFVYSCAFEHQRGFEQFTEHHVLAFQFSGETHIHHQNGKLVLKKNQLLLVQKNQLAKFIKIPATNKEYKIISVIITDAALQQFALDNSIHKNRNYNSTGKTANDCCRKKAGIDHQY